MVSRLRIAFAVLACVLVAPALAHAAGGNYAFAGGTSKQQAEVRAALEASSFDWSLVPVQIKVHIAPGLSSEATRGEIWLDADLLNAGRFAWGTIQHEYAHQVDYFLLDDAKRAQLQAALGGSNWCYSVPGLVHGAYGCERFASTLAWAYWPSPDNAMRPESSHDESAAMPVAQFRVLLGSLIGAPTRLLLRTR
jgi:hypothetical protein